MEIKQLFGKKVRNLRIKKGLTQDELAKMAGISQRSLSGIETGENFLSAETLTNLLKCFDISIDELFMIEHLKPTDELIKEISNDIKNLHDEEKIKTIYKLIKTVLRD